MRSPLAAAAAASASSSSAAAAAPLPAAQIEAGSELLSLIDGIPAALWPLKGGLRLLFEFAQQSRSFYAPYIHLLPNSFPSIPLFWSPAQVAALQYEPLAAQLKLRSAFLRNKSAELATRVNLFGAQAAELTTPERLAWAMSCVSSRAFQLRSDAGHCTSLPLVDMMNHSYDNNCKVVFEAAEAGATATPPPASASFDDHLRFAQQTLQVVAVRDIAPHSELTLNYGHHSNDHFLLNFGFLLDDNPADVLECKRDAEAMEVAADMAGEKVTEWAASPAWKKVIAREAGVSVAANAAASSASSLVLPFRLTRDEIDPQLIALVHVMLAPNGEPQTTDQRSFASFLQRAVGVEAASKSNAATTEGASAVSDQHWTPAAQDLSKQPAAVLRVLYSYLSLLQSSFATTLAQDVEALGNIVTTIVTASGSDRHKEEAVEREELAIRFRIGKKRIVGEQMRRVQKAMGQASG